MLPIPHQLRSGGGGLPLLLSLLLVACGGGGDGAADPVAPPASCSVADQNSWLSNYMDEWYLWYRQAPRPDAGGYSSVQAYFSARLYAGGDATLPFAFDRWSNNLSTDDFNRFFGDGATLGFGVSVNGVEVDGAASQPLWVRYVDPGSPAAAAGVQRGDQVISLNGRAVADLVSARDYSALGASQAGAALTLVLRRAGADRTVALSAAVYNLAPVPAVAVQRTAGGRKLALLQVQQMISQALAPVDAAFAQFRSEAVDDLVLDLRYNGGGLVSTGATLASYIAGSRGSGLAYARLLFNDKRSGSNSVYSFSQPAQALSLPRVFVLAGPRTCSASEQVVNGLLGAGLQVVVVGNTSCGKPVGFQPTSNCGRTYNVVNFESVNQLGTGRYFDGLNATCAVAEDFTAAQNGAADPLLNAARQFADTGRCPPSALVPQSVPQRRPAEPGQMELMLAR